RVLRSILQCPLACCQLTDFDFLIPDRSANELHTLSLHDALPIFADEQDAVHMLAQDRESARRKGSAQPVGDGVARLEGFERSGRDRTSTRLNSSHGSISYAVFCLNKIKRPIRSQRA